MTYMAGVKGSFRAHRDDMSRMSGQKHKRLELTCCLRICSACHSSAAYQVQQLCYAQKKKQRAIGWLAKSTGSRANPTAQGQLSTDFQRISAFHREPTLGLDHRPETFWQNVCALYAGSGSGAVLVRAAAHRVRPREGFRDRNSKLSGTKFQPP